MYATHGRTTPVRTPAASTDFWPDHPFRSAVSRWARVHEHAAGQGRRRDRDDKRGIGSLHDLVSWQRGGDRIGPAVAGEDPTIPGAVPLQDGISRRRREGETRILAWQSDRKIGSRPGVLTRRVEAHENLFDCFPEILQATDWIRCQAIGPTVFEELNEGRVDLIGKLRAFLRGSLVLDALVVPLDGRRGEPTDGLEAGTTLLCERIIAVKIRSSTDDPIRWPRRHALVREIDVEQVRKSAQAVSGVFAIPRSGVWIDPEPAREMPARDSEDDRIRRRGVPRAVQPGSEEKLSQNRDSRAEKGGFRPKMGVRRRLVFRSGREYHVVPVVEKRGMGKIGYLG
jgi:hypothetical protein